MGAASSTSANNTYYKNHVQEIINKYPITTTQGSWKFWSGRTINVTVDGKQHAYPVDYMLESTKNPDEEGVISVNMYSLWPDNYPITAFHGSFNEITWVYCDIDPIQNTITIRHTYDVSSQDLSQATPEEIKATKSLLHESVCILLRMAQLAQSRHRQTTVVATVYVDELPFFKELGFKVQSWSDETSFYEMAGMLDQLVHRCRQEHLFRDTDTESIPLKKHVAEILANLSGVRSLALYKIPTGRAVTLHDGGETRVYPLDYELTMEPVFGGESSGFTHQVLLDVKWPKQYPRTQLRKLSLDFMTSVKINILTSHIDITCLNNAAVSFSNAALPAEKTALAGLVSEGLCIMLHVIQKWKGYRSTRRVTIDAPNVENTQVNFAQETQKASIDKVTKMFEHMGFRAVPDSMADSPFETFPSMESTFGELLANCEYRLVEDKDLL